MTTLATPARNAACNATVDLADAGSGSGFMRVRQGTTTLCDITLAKPAFGNAGANVIGRAECNGLPLSGTCSASGVPDNYQILDSTGALCWSGTAGTSGTDAILDQASVAIGQTLTILAFTMSQPS